MHPFRILLAFLACAAAARADIVITEVMYHPVEKAAGLQMPVGLYALIESAFRAKNGWSIDAHRDRLAALYEAMSRVAHDNPHAWNRAPVPAAAIRNLEWGALGAGVFGVCSAAIAIAFWMIAIRSNGN